MIMSARQSTRDFYNTALGSVAEVYPHWHQWRTGVPPLACLCLLHPDRFPNFPGWSNPSRPRHYRQNWTYFIQNVVKLNMDFGLSEANINDYVAPHQSEFFLDLFVAIRDEFFPEHRNGAALQELLVTLPQLKNISYAPPDTDNGSEPSSSGSPQHSLRKRDAVTREELPPAPEDIVEPFLPVGEISAVPDMSPNKSDPPERLSAAEVTDTSHGSGFMDENGTFPSTSDLPEIDDGSSQTDPMDLSRKHFKHPINLDVLKMAIAVRRDDDAGRAETLESEKQTPSVSAVSTSDSHVTAVAEIADSGLPEALDTYLSNLMGRHYSFFSELNSHRTGIPTLFALLAKRPGLKSLQNVRLDPSLPSHYRANWNLIRKALTELGLSRSFIDSFSDQLIEQLVTNGNEHVQREWADNLRTVLFSGLPSKEIGKMLQANAPEIYNQTILPPLESDILSQSLPRGNQTKSSASLATSPVKIVEGCGVRLFGRIKDNPSSMVSPGDWIDTSGSTAANESLGSTDLSREMSPEISDRPVSRVSQLSDREPSLPDPGESLVEFCTAMLGSVLYRYPGDLCGGAEYVFLASVLNPKATPMPPVVTNPGNYSAAVINFTSLQKLLEPYGILVDVKELTLNTDGQLHKALLDSIRAKVFSNARATKFTDQRAALQTLLKKEGVRLDLPYKTRGLNVTVKKTADGTVFYETSPLERGVRKPTGTDQKLLNARVQQSSSTDATLSNITPSTCRYRKGLKRLRVLESDDEGDDDVIIIEPSPETKSASSMHYGITTTTKRSLQYDDSPAEPEQKKPDFLPRGFHPSRGFVPIPRDVDSGNSVRTTRSGIVYSPPVAKPSTSRKREHKQLKRLQRANRNRAHKEVKPRKMSPAKTAQKTEAQSGSKKSWIVPCCQKVITCNTSQVWKHIHGRLYPNTEHRIWPCGTWRRNVRTRPRYLLQVRPAGSVQSKIAGGEFAPVAWPTMQQQPMVFDLNDGPERTALIAEIAQLTIAGVITASMRDSEKADIVGGIRAARAAAALEAPHE